MEIKIDTRDFGEITIKEKDVVEFQEGIPGFEVETEFVLLEDKELEDFKILQSVNNKDVRLIVINPLEIFEDYDITINNSTMEKLDIEDNLDVSIFTTVTFRDKITETTTNLTAPIIINNKEMLGKQVIVNSKYTTQHYIFPQEGGDE